MISRLQAAAAGLPFMPMNQTAATDLEHNNPNIRRVQDPYSGREVITVPPLNPDVGIIHVQRCDKNGNSHIWGIVGEQKEVAFASKNVIITAEEIVDEDVIRSDPNRTIIPEMIVKAVCHVPHCAHPSYTQGYYDRDNVFYLNWDKISENPETVKQWLNEWVYGVKDCDGYWQKLGAETHKRLQVKPKYAAPVNYGDY
jgi:glutaconate CoA-transferase subunit A